MVPGQAPSMAPTAAMDEGSRLLVGSSSSNRFASPADSMASSSLARSTGVERHVRPTLVPPVADAQVGPLERDGGGAGRDRERELAGPVALVDHGAPRLHPLDLPVE